MLAPDSVQEAVDFTYQAFDLADKYRNPVLILGDGMMGQMMEPVVMPPEKTEFEEKPWAATGPLRTGQEDNQLPVYRPGGAGAGEPAAPAQV